MRDRKPLVFYERYGALCVRSNCTSMHQTEATKASAKNFGVAARAGSGLRSLLPTVIPFPKDKVMQRCFERALRQWLQTLHWKNTAPQNDIPFITGFQFNSETNFGERCRIGMQVNRAYNGSISLVIPSFVPAQQIIAPAYTQNIQVNIAAAAYDLLLQTVTDNYSQSISIHYNHVPVPSAEIPIPLITGAGKVIIVAVSFSYCALQNGIVVPVNNKRWMPAGVISGLYN